MIKRQAVLCPLLLLASASLVLAERPKVGVRGEVETGYTDNFYRLTDKQTREFGTRQSPGDRFSGMDDPEDLVTRLELRTELDWKLARKRHAMLDLRAGYAVHDRNDVADYPWLDARLDVDVSRVDRVYGGIELILDRFWKNYRIPSTSVFAAAVYDQTEATFGYRREIRKHLHVGGELRHRDRTYDRPLDSRDRDGNYLRGYTMYRLKKGVEAETSLELADVEFDPVQDGTVEVDRSYDQWKLDQSFRFELSPSVRLDAGIRYHERESTTDNREDLARFGREDDRWRLDLALRRELTGKLDLEGFLRYTDNDSSRLDPTIEADEVGYEETRFGIGLRYRFRR